ncbi:MAG: methyltransferase domain-containing protein [Deltaproteobacteria bacterium]
MICRFCEAPLSRTFTDLGMQPLSNAFIDEADAGAPETFYPLHARVCDRCFLVQLPALATPEKIFTDYAYLSSVSASWLAHCGRYVEEVSIRFNLGPKSFVVELASNDGYLLKFFRDRQVPVLGIEPAANVAAIAEQAGVPTLAKFFSTALARELVSEGRRPDLIVANNVLAHVPDLNDFVAGIGLLLGPSGVLSVEVPHLLRLIEQTQFDTIYHEHFSYFSLGTILRVFEAHDLSVFDVQEVPTHGGSLRVFARHKGALPARGESVQAILETEKSAGLTTPVAYERFSEAVFRTKRLLLRFLIEQRDAGKRVVGYGAPAKGNTLLNFCGIRSDLLEYTVDRSPLKQGRLLPGTHIPVFDPDRINETRPDVVLILPWNIKAEVVSQLAFTEAWGCRLVVPVPVLAEAA